jgi:hypothetical protein
MEIMSLQSESLMAFFYSLNTDQQEMFLHQFVKEQINHKRYRSILSKIMNEYFLSLGLKDCAIYEIHAPYSRSRCNYLFVIDVSSTRQGPVIHMEDVYVSQHPFTQTISFQCDGESINEAFTIVSNNIKGAEKEFLEKLNEFSSETSNIAGLRF